MAEDRATDAAARGLVKASTAPLSVARRDHALVIGTDRYDQWPSLRLAVRDARDVATELERRYRFETSLVVDGTAEQVRQAVEAYGHCPVSGPRQVGRCGPEDQLLVFVAGHGHFDGVQGGVVLRDSAPASERFGANRLDFTTLQRLLECTGCKHVLLVMDICYGGTASERVAMSGRASRGGPAASTALEQLRYRSRRMLTSVGKAATSDDSPFAKALLGALRAPRDGILTLGGLVAAVEASGARPVYASFGLDDEPEGGFVLDARAAPPERSVAALPSVPERTGGQSSPAIPWSTPTVRPPPTVVDVAVGLTSADSQGGQLMRTKLERNLVERLVASQVAVSHPAAARGAESAATYRLAGSLLQHGEGWNVSLELQAKGRVLGQSEIDLPDALLRRTYRVLPEALLRLMAYQAVGGEDAFRPDPRRQPTRDPSALVALLAGRQELGRGAHQAAGELLREALERDPRCADAAWLLGLAERSAGRPEEAAKWAALADRLDPDHERPDLGRSPANPVPALRQASRSTPWAPAAAGLRWRRVMAASYGVTVTAWALDPALFEFDVLQAVEPTGETAASVRGRSGAALVVNGGFFDLDAERRMTPAGLLVVGGALLGAAHPGAGSGALVVEEGVPRIVWAKEVEPGPKVGAALQSGPFLVDPGGGFGIKKNDFNRVPRTAVCAGPLGVVVVVVEGGLSLYEVAQLMADPTDQGGLGCERALNLDGGPSTQASFLVGGVGLEVQGVWKLHHALVARARPPRSP